VKRSEKFTHVHVRIHAILPSPTGSSRVRRGRPSATSTPVAIRRRYSRHNAACCGRSRLGWHRQRAEPCTLRVGAAEPVEPVATTSLKMHATIVDLCLLRPLAARLSVRPFFPSSGPPFSVWCVSQILQPLIHTVHTYVLLKPQTTTKLQHDTIMNDYKSNQIKYYFIVRIKSWQESWPTWSAAHKRQMLINVKC